MFDDQKLFYACGQGEVEEVRKYLSQGANVNFKDWVCFCFCFCFCFVLFCFCF